MSQTSTVENQSELLFTIFRSEIEKSLNSVSTEKLKRPLTSSELNDYSTSGISKLLNDQTEKNTSTSTNELDSVLTSNIHQIFDNVYKQFELQSKKKIEKQELLNILKDLSNKEQSNDGVEDEQEDEETNEDEEENEDDVEDENDETENEKKEDDEECCDMTEEEFAREIAEAFEHVRNLGRIDGQRIAKSIQNSFREMNGRDPELREIADVFTRIKNKLAEEAKEDNDNLLSSSRNIVIKDDITNDDNKENTQQTNDTNKQSPSIVKTLRLENIDINNASEEEKKELLNFARAVVKKDLQTQAETQLSKLIGREPTKQELNDMLVQLATTSLLDCNFDSGDDASDYNPDTQEEKQQLLNDIAETEAFDEENSRDQEEPTLINKPVLTTPVKNKGTSARVDYYFEQYNDDCSELLINKAVTSFKKMHDRMPSNEELDNMKHFLHTEKANLLNDEALINENDKENTSFKLNFGAEDVVDVD